MIRPAVKFFIGLLVALSPLGAATAHSTLVRSSPAVNEQLATAPTTIVLFFDDELDATVSEFRLVDATQQPISGVVGEVDLTDPNHARLVAENMPPLPNGIYEIQWTALSLDGDGAVVQGSFQFSVGVAAPAQPTQLSTYSIAATPTHAPTPTPASPSGFEMVPGLALGGLIVSIVFMLFSLARRK